MPRQSRCRGRPSGSQSGRTVGARSLKGKKISVIIGYCGTILICRVLTNNYKLIFLVLPKNVLITIIRLLPFTNSVTISDHHCVEVRILSGFQFNCCSCSKLDNFTNQLSSSLLLLSSSSVVLGLLSWVARLWDSYGRCTADIRLV